MWRLRIQPSRGGGRARYCSGTSSPLATRSPQPPDGWPRRTKRYNSIRSAVTSTIWRPTPRQRATSAPTLRGSRRVGRNTTLTGSCSPGLTSESRGSAGRGPRCGGCQCCVAHRETAADFVDGVPDAVKYLGDLVLRELGEGTGGAFQVQPFVAGVWLVPVELPLLRFVEPVRLSAPGGGLGA